MGVHRKEAGVKVINFIQSLGNVLNYHVMTEEPMFPGSPTSSDLDVTWRRNKHAKFPLFVFEIESSPTKSASDNVVKVFSRKTPIFHKPLFFYHIFVEKAMDTERIDYLKEYYDKLNYATYLISDESSAFQLFSDILDQHFRIESHLDLYSLINLIEKQPVLNVSSSQILTKLIDLGYDKFEKSNFLMTLETLLINENYPSIREFYLPYLSEYLLYDIAIRQRYYYATPLGYSEVIHNSFLLLLTKNPDYDFFFHKLQQIEEGFQPWKLWEPHFGMSRDHDMMLSSEFPLLLTMLCVAFSTTSHAAYFSGKLKTIFSTLQDFRQTDLHGLTWLLIASQIADDQESYEFARSRINDNGGIPLHFIVHPSVFVTEDDERSYGLQDLQDVPEYREWQNWLSPYRTYLYKIKVDVLSSIIQGFLVMNDPETGRAMFSAFCLQESLKSRHKQAT